MAEIPSIHPEVSASEGERMVYLVPSRTNPKATPYRVDLLALGGYSQCHCVDWQTRRWPAIRDGAPAGTRATLCRHGVLARRHFLNQLLREMAAGETST